MPLLRIVILSLSFAGLVARGLSAQAAPLDAGAQRALVGKIATLLREEYVFVDVGERAAAELMRRVSAGAYDAPRSPADFAAALSNELGSLTRDRHVRVRFAPASNADARMPQELDPSPDNFGVHRVEWLANRIGYLKIDRFYEFDESRKTYDAALALLSGAAAIVIDLRDNGGGSDANNLLGSYFFADRTKFNELRWRKEAAEELWTDPSVQPRLPSTPIVVLTSARTFSAAEAFAYSLQQHKRATIIGEKTAGGANPNRYFPLAPGLAVSVSIGTTVHPISQANWEGTGVQPDIETPRDAALERALQYLASQAPR